MALITVNVDTVAKTIDVSVDGQTQSNVKEVRFDVYEDYYEPGRKQLFSSIVLSEKDPNTAITKTTYLTATDNSLVEGEDFNKVKNDIAQYFSRL